MALTKSKKHFVGLTWADGDKKAASRCNVTRMTIDVSADLKGIHFSRFQGEPDGGLMSQTHTGTLAAFGD